MRLRGRLILHDTMLAIAREDLALLQAAVPGLHRRYRLGRRVAELQQRVVELQRERLH